MRQLVIAAFMGLVAQASNSVPPPTAFTFSGSTVVSVYRIVHIEGTTNVVRRLIQRMYKRQQGGTHYTEVQSLYFEPGPGVPAMIVNEWNWINVSDGSWYQPVGGRRRELFSINREKVDLIPAHAYLPCNGVPANVGRYEMEYGNTYVTVDQYVSMRIVKPSNTGVMDAQFSYIALPTAGGRVDVTLIKRLQTGAQIESFSPSLAAASAILGTPVRGLEYQSCSFVPVFE